MASGLDRHFLGCLYFVISIVGLSLHGLVCYIIISRKEFRQHMAYIIMFNAGLFDSTILISGLNASAMTLLNSKFIVEQLFGGIQNSSWMVTISIDLLLALNRLDVICLNLKLHSTTKHRIAAVCLSAQWLYWLGLLVCHLLKDSGVRYSLNDLFFHITENPVSQVIATIELYTTGPFCCVVLVIYLIIGVSMLWKRHMHFKNSISIKTSSQEIRILGQAVIMFSFVFGIVLCWHLGGYILPASVWSGRGIYISFLLRAGMGPVMVLVFNKRFRLTTEDIIRGNEVSSVVKVTSVALSSARKSNSQRN
ncbi:hypothetical protein L596_029381 [Steinernema carpocapsae]|uniref:7TM GPCR serpentine receptor class x (Srx) domain-containing protein n=1 Tax=Steinernema carpocapsae TaxID=34508 RepID=A0A4U5LUG7_STECR|nr:hypothetical protein L596_029381 [Steinernema carpocapsae]